jgi:hypothetical protein
MTTGIDQFFTADGRLVSIPAKKSKRVLVLQRIAGIFETGTRYPEKQLNEMLAELHPDTAAIRRYMVEQDILERDNATSSYWLAAAQKPE